MIKLVIADDHPMVREGLKTMLETAPDGGFSIAGEVASGTELVNRMPELEADVVLMDINMPEMDGLQATRHVRQHYPHIKVLILSMLDEERFVADALEAGASGYLLKTVNRKELSRAVQVTAGGETYICTDIALKMLGKTPHTRSKEVYSEEKGTNNLSKRELEVLGLISKGNTTTQMAEMLFTSKRTIESHRQHLLEKTGSKNTASLITYAATHHLLE